MRIPALSLAILAATFSLLSCAGAPAPEPLESRAGDTPAEDAAFDATGVQSGDPVPPLTATESSVECRYQRVTGSHMMQKVCTTAEQRRLDEQASKQWMRTRGRSGGVSKVRDPADPRDKDDD